MKKSLMILASVALGASMAVGQDVESKNVVGFENVNLPVTQYTALGWQFALVGGNTNIPIASITNYANPKTHSSSFNSADGIRKFVPATSTYINYFRHTSLQWRLVGEVTETTDVIHPGEHVMFIKRTTASTNTQSGEVIANDVNIPVPVSQYTAMCNPFPVEIAINSITNYPNPKAHSSSFNSADGIRKWVPASSSYVNYFRHSPSLEWRKVGETSATADIIAPGEGFMFFKRTTNSVVTFSTPIP